MSCNKTSKFVLQYTRLSLHNGNQLVGLWCIRNNVVVIGDNQVDDIAAPVSGEIIAINEAVVADPTLVNTEPHTQGWLFKIKVNNKTELDNLLTVDKYTALIS